MAGKGSGTGLHFAVIDTETTMDSQGRSRVIEIAVVRIRRDGVIIDTFESLVRPPVRVKGYGGRIHGIRTNDLAHAPTFGQVFGAVAARLRAAIPIAHHATADERALNFELREQGMQPISIGCTIWLGKNLGLFGTKGNSLSNCCLRYGIPLEDAHTALGDARATAALLLALLDAGAVDTPSRCSELGLPPALGRDCWPEAGEGVPPVSRAEVAQLADLHRRERAGRGRKSASSAHPASLQERLALVEAAIPTAKPLDRVKLIQERMDLRVALSRKGADV